MVQQHKASDQSVSTLGTFITLFLWKSGLILMLKLDVFRVEALFSFRKIVNLQRCYGSSTRLHKDNRCSKSWLVRAKVSNVMVTSGLESWGTPVAFLPVKLQVVADDNQGDLLDEDDDLCPVDCVREFKTDEEFQRILGKAKETDSLVVVDFYRTACGSCKYIEQGFSKLCKGSGNGDGSVIFLKHNVIDEYDEPSEVAERLRIKAVPLFHFYKNGVLLEAFPTRDKERIVNAIMRERTSHSQDVGRESKCVLLYSVPSTGIFTRLIAAGHVASDRPLAESTKAMALYIHQITYDADDVNSNSRSRP